MKMQFKPNDISQYRQALMGIGILGVMATHWCGFQSITSGIIYNACYVIGKLVFTEGLLFLSGFGLYYSFSKNPEVKQFYQKRMKRLYIPFLILSVPLYVFFLVSDREYSIAFLIEQLSTAYFWIHGNYGGMWYVAISVALYLLFPLFYRFVFSGEEKKGVLVRGIVLLLFVVLVFSILLVNEAYFQMVAIGVTKIPMFVLGIIYAYFTKSGELSNKMYVYLIISLTAVYFVLSFIKQNYWAGISVAMVQKLVFMPLICFSFRLIESGKLKIVIKQPLDWFGKYSLELYILHLHTYMFLLKCGLFESMSIMWKATLAMIVALVLCVPTNKVLSFIINKKTI